MNKLGVKLTVDEAPIANDGDARQDGAPGADVAIDELKIINAPLNDDEV